MEPLTILLLFPVAIGIAAQLVFDDARKAACTATLGSALAVFVALYARDPGGTWNWLAALLVLPLPVAFALAAVVLCYGRARRPRKGGGPG
jgi:hypothetical protein